MKIGFAQIVSEGTLNDRAAAAEKACRALAEDGASIVLFPEMYSDGYCIPQDRKKLADLAISRDDPFVTRFSALACELGTVIAITYLEKLSGEGFRNAMSVFDATGARMLDYAKTHTCTFGDERVLDAGDELPVADLTLSDGSKVRTGCMICYDREFPETARVLMLNGAELILVPNACWMEINRLAQLRARAFENMLAIATCNYPLGMPGCNGHSTLFDGIAFEDMDSPSRDMCVMEAGEQPGLYMGHLDLCSLRGYRSCESWGPNHRCPELYTCIVEGI